MAGVEGPEASGPQGAQRAGEPTSRENIDRSLSNALGKALEDMLNALKGSLPKLKLAEELANMFGAIGNLLTGGTAGKDVPWNEQPGNVLTNEATMSHFMEAWIFFTAATGGTRPPGISKALWAQAKALAKKSHLPPSVLQEMETILKDPAFQKLAADVIQNSQVYGQLNGELAKRRGLFKGKQLGQYNQLEGKLEAYQQQLFNLDPKSPTYKTDKARLEGKIETVKGDMKDLAKQAGVEGPYDAITAKVESLQTEHMGIMDRVRNQDIPAVQAGRVDGSSRYGRLNAAARGMTSYSSGILGSAKAKAQYYAMMAGKIGPIWSNMLKKYQDVEQFVRGKMNE